MSTSSQLAASFRDPSGFIFQREGRLFRQINRAYQPDYDQLMDSGLYARLVRDGQLIAHEEATERPHQVADSYKVLLPTLVPFISYPYEWCFSQFHAAALLTLAIQKRALEAGMILKDASAFNVQFLGTRPVLVDTLSFERYVEGEPWVAYRQFCQHFLAPLALMSLKEPRLAKLFRTYLDGIPLDLASTLLPWRSRVRLSLLVHVHFHARLQQSFAGRADKPRPRPISRHSLLGLIDSLETAVRRLAWRPTISPWLDYTESNSYSTAALAQKEQAVAAFLDRAAPRTVWDLGANTGRFSALAAERGATVVAFDSDPACVERMYREGSRRGVENVLPLWLDLSNPSPAVGWAHSERLALAERGPADAVLALGLIHHLALSNNVPLDAIARWLGSLGHWVIIEFIPKDDPQVGRLLVSRKDVFPDYSRSQFERSFAAVFEVQACQPLADGGRVVYLMRRRNA